MYKGDLEGGSGGRKEGGEGSGVPPALGIP
jgi:hypothetical protein